MKRLAFSLPVAVALLVALAALFAVGVVALAAGAGLSGWLLAPAVLAGALAGAAVSGEWRWARAVVLGLALVGLGAVALAGASWFHDVSWDGQVYHQPAVLALAGGWNPLWDGPLALGDRPDNLWINHYPKAAWVVQAILLDATGSLEATKGVQLLALLAAALAVLAALGPSWRGLLVAAVAAANPVALVQAFSFYVDGMSASLMTAFAAQAFVWLRRPARATGLAVAAALVLLVNLKFTGLIYAGVLVAGLTLGLARWWPARWRGIAALGGVALAVGAVALGFDPYVTNTRSHGHPLYPVAGAGAVDFLSIQLSPEFHQRSRPQRLVVGLLARASNDNRAPELKLPFTVQPRELGALPEADLRLGGFGPLFSGVLVAAVIIALGRKRLGVSLPGPLLAAGALVLASAFCNPALWWARYVPQLWLLPAGLLAWLLLAPPPAGPAPAAPGGRARFAAAALAALLLANITLVGVTAAGAQVRASRQVERQLRALGPGLVPVHWNGFDGNRARLAAAGVSHQSIDGRRSLPCQRPVRLVRSLAEVCPPAPGPLLIVGARRE